MEIQRLLVLSTSHISETTNKWLEETLSDLYQPLKIAPIDGGPYTGSGWFIYCPEHNVAIPDSVPDDLWNAMTYARGQRCSYLLLDRDGDYVDELTQYEW